jgi:hypothetical protein
MQLVIPSASRSAFSLAPIDQAVWIAGIRRPDAYCQVISLGTAGQPGHAEIFFERGQYDSALCVEGDLVEVKVNRIGTVHRGTISGRRTDLTDLLVYQSTDLLDRFDATHFEQEFNFVDDVDQEEEEDLLGGTTAVKARKNVATVRQMAWWAYATYLTWLSYAAPDEYALSIDLESFPATVPGVTHILGQPLLQGLQQALEAVDYRYRITVDHTDGASTIRAFLLGSGRARGILRCSDPTAAYTAQPGGQGNAESLSKSVDVRSTISHVWAEGDNRIFESAFALAQGWNEVADDYEPPAGKTLLDYVTESERDAVINNPDRYTKHKLDVKSADKTTNKVENPNYRPKFERVARVWTIPRQNDMFYIDDDDETYPDLMGETNRQLKIESGLVQDLNGKELSHFLVCKRTGKDELFIKFDGFTVRQSREVHLMQPLVDSVSNVLGKGIRGVYVADSWDSESKTSQYQIDELSLNSILTTADVTAGCWLVLGEIGTFYKVDAFTMNTLTVWGNLTNAGSNKDDGTKYAGGQWFIIKADPVKKSGTDGAGAEYGQYLIATGESDELTNEYLGAYLICGEFDETKICFTGAPADYAAHVWKIARSSANDLWVNNTEKDMITEGANYIIARYQLETKRLFEWVKLNCCWSSRQKLVWDSGALNALRGARQVMKTNTEFKWRTMYGNYLLVKSSEEGEEDKYTPVYNAAMIDRIKHQAELGAWAANQVNGADLAQKQITASILPVDWTLKVGDVATENNGEQEVSVTGITIDLGKQVQTVTGSAWM